MKSYSQMSRRELLRELARKDEQATEALRRTEEHCHALCNCMNIGFFLGEIICDDSGNPHDYRFLETNDFFEKETGLKSAEVKGRTILELFPSIEASWIETYGKVALTGESTRFENYSHDTGRHYEVFAFSPAKGQFAALGKDITTRKQAEQALCKSEERYRTLFMSLSEGFFLCQVLYDDSGAPCDYRYLDVNPAFEQIIGFERARIIDKPLRELFPNYTPLWMELFIKVAVTGTPSHCCYFAEPFRRYIDVHAFKPAEDQVAVLVTDITERKQMQDALLKNQQDLKQANELLEQRVSERTAELEAAIRVQESFSYSVSHDLRAPLRHINSFSSILMEEHWEELSASARGYLDRICVASGRMGALIDHLLELFRVSNTSIRQENVDLSELATAALGMFQEIDSKRSARLVVQQGLIALGDHSLLRQLLENLLGNAWKYTSKQREARIEFGKTAVSGQEAYFVKDNGAGFDMSYKDKLFTAFDRLHGAEFEGIGIGLATSQQIVRRHNGTIWAEGRVDHGATFYFTLSTTSGS